MKIESVEVSYMSPNPGDFPPEERPEIAFLGRSNVGKSSLINSLVNRKKLARTSKAPGRTRAIHWYGVGGGELACYFVDLPGYGYAKVSRQIREEVWAALIETYLRSHQRHALAIQLLDIRRDGPTDLDWQMIEWLRAADRPVAYVLTKADKLSRSRRLQAVQKFSRVLDMPIDARPIAYSATTGEGKDQLWSRIDSCLSAA